MCPLDKGPRRLEVGLYIGPGWGLRFPEGGTIRVTEDGCLDFPAPMEVVRPDGSVERKYQAKHPANPSCSWCVCRVRATGVYGSSLGTSWDMALLQTYKTEQEAIDDIAERIGDVKQYGPFTIMKVYG